MSIIPGLERLLQAELAELGLRSHPRRGGVEARGSTDQLWQVVLSSRLAESVRVRLKPFRAADFATLQKGLGQLPWHAYFRPRDPIALRVSCQKSHLYHSDAVAERAFRVIASKLGSHLTRPSAGPWVPTAYVRIERDVVQVSVDASGERLHRRGYRTHIGGAPLRETVAAALVRLVEEAAARGSETSRPPTLWDPFCGAGTVAIEWAARRLDIPAGGARHYAFERWPIHDASAYTGWLSQHPIAAEPPASSSPIAYGSDISSRVLKAAAHNAGLAGLVEYCCWLPGDFQDVAAKVPAGSLIVTNPPYGVRLDRRGLSALYARFDRMLEMRPDLRPVVLACGFLPYLHQSRLGWRVATRVRVGGLPVALLTLR